MSGDNANPAEVSVLDMSELSDLVPGRGWEITALAIGVAHDGREWLIDGNGRARQLPAGDHAEALISARSLEGEVERVPVPVGRLRRLGVRERADVRLFVQDQPESSRDQTTFGHQAFFYSGAQACFDLLAGTSDAGHLR